MVPPLITGGENIASSPGSCAIDEDKILAAERIILQLITDQGTQVSERFAHAGGLCAEPDQRLIIEPDHPS